MARKLGEIIATLENLEQQEQFENPQEDIEAADTAVETIDATAEVDSGEAAIAEDDAVLTQAEDAQDTVDELTAVAEDSLVGEGETVTDGVGTEGPGLTEGEANIVEITHESIMQSLGLTREYKTYTPESFRQGADRRQATLEALDNLKASAKKIGQNIAQALKAAWNTVANFLTGLLRNRAVMEKHISNLMAKVKGVAGKQKASETLTQGAAALSVEGQASPATAERLLGSAMKLIKISENVSGALNGNIEGVTAAAQSGGQDKYEMTNGRTVTVTSDADGVKFDVQTGQTAKEIPAPDQGQMTRLLTQAMGVIKALRAYEATQSKLKSAINAIISKLQSAGAYIRDKMPGAKKEGAGEGAPAGAGPGAEAAAASPDQDAKKNARMARQVMNKVGGTFPAAAFNAVKATADYVTAGVNNYKAAEAPTPAPTAPQQVTGAQA